MVGARSIARTSGMSFAEGLMSGPAAMNVACMLTFRWMLTRFGR